MVYIVREDDGRPYQLGFHMGRSNFSMVTFLHSWMLTVRMVALKSLEPRIVLLCFV